MLLGGVRDSGSGIRRPVRHSQHCEAHLAPIGLAARGASTLHPLVGAMASSLHSWETKPAVFPLDLPENDAPDSGGSDGEEELTADEANAALADLLLDMNTRRILSAKHVCVIAFWASKVGLGGVVASLALNPSASTGHFQRKLDRATRFDQTLHEVQYELTIPSHDRAQVERDIKVIPVVPPHEALQREVRDRPTLRDKLAELVRDKTMPDDYFCHPVVRQHELGTVFPLQLFVDGVPTTKKDSMIGCHVVNVCCQQRAPHCGMFAQVAALRLWLPRLVQPVPGLRLSPVELFCSRLGARSFRQA